MLSVGPLPVFRPLASVLKVRSKIQNSCYWIAARNGSTLQSGTMACAATLPESPGVCDIYIESPSDRNDKLNIKTLGHELWHCFGAQHD